MRVQGAPHNHGTKTLVVAGSQGRKGLDHNNNHHLAQRAHTPYVCFHNEAPCNLLFYVGPCLNFDQILHFFSAREREGIPCHVTTPWGGGGKQAKASKIVILCYFLSIFYQINNYKNIQNIKNYLLRPVPPGGGGVWCDILVSNVKTIHQMLLLYIINMEVPTPGDSLS